MSLCVSDKIVDIDRQMARPAFMPPQESLLHQMELSERKADSQATLAELERHRDLAGTDGDDHDRDHIFGDLLSDELDDTYLNLQDAHICLET